MISKFRATLTRPDLQCVLRKIGKLLIENEIHLWMEHIAGEKNITADKLSRFYENPLSECSVPLKNIPTRCHKAVQEITTLCEQFEIERQYLVKDTRLT